MHSTGNHHSSMLLRDTWCRWSHVSTLFFCLLNNIYTWGITHKSVIRWAVTACHFSRQLLSEETPPYKNSYFIRVTLKLIPYTEGGPIWRVVYRCMIVILRYTCTKAIFSHIAKNHVHFMQRFFPFTLLIRFDMSQICIILLLLLTSSTLKCMS